VNCFEVLTDFSYKFGESLLITLLFTKGKQMKLNGLLLAIVLGVAISFCGALWAQGGDAPAQGGNEPARGGDVSGNPDFSPVTKAVDTNGDGKMSREEWTSKGLPMSSFNMFENGRDYVTQKDYEENAAPSGIDINGDGKLTVEEFLEFDKSMSGGGAPGSAPSGSPKSGGAPGEGDPGGNR